MNCMGKSFFSVLLVSGMQLGAMGSAQKTSTALARAPITFNVSKLYKGAAMIGASCALPWHKLHSLPKPLSWSGGLLASAGMNTVVDSISINFLPKHDAINHALQGSLALASSILIEDNPAEPEMTPLSAAVYRMGIKEIGRAGIGVAQSVKNSLINLFKAPAHTAKAEESEQGQQASITHAALPVRIANALPGITIGSLLIYSAIAGCRSRLIRDLFNNDICYAPEWRSFIRDVLLTEGTKKVADSISGIILPNKNALSRTIKGSLEIASGVALTRLGYRNIFPFSWNINYEMYHIADGLHQTGLKEICCAGIDLAKQLLSKKSAINSMVKHDEQQV